MFRQRPGSAKGTMFITLEDDTGIVNLIVRPPLIDAQREIVVGGHLLLARGILQKQGSDESGWIIHVIAEEFADRSHWIGARSEEHTSELPSLMRISYAVFCLKKKNK